MILSWGLFFVILIGILYFLLILWLILGVKRVPEFIAYNSLSQTQFSIIIPFRDEAANLPALLHSIAQIDYPNNQFELLFVNDDSSDHSVQLVQHFVKEHPSLNLSILENQRHSLSPKKDAITTAIKQSKFDWILTTDADCVLSKKWLKTYDAYISENNSKFIAGLVSFQNKKNFLYQFQQFDWMSLVGVTMGSFGWQKPLLCSGANLGYSKQAFVKVDGFKGNDQIASGDDVFLLNKMQKAFPEQVIFLNSSAAIVQTKSEKSWHTLVQQRIRWAAKTSKIPDRRTIGIGLIVFLTNLILLILFVTVLFQSEYLILLSVLFLSKLILDSLLVLKVAKLIKQKFAFIVWILSSLLYPFFSVAIALLGAFSGYKWKGRRFLK